MRVQLRREIMARSVAISKWGNCLAIRIPQFVVDNLDIKAGDVAKLSYEGDTITMRVSNSNQKRFEAELESLYAFKD